MAAFFSDLLDGFLNPVFIEKTGKKFHFEEAQMEELWAVAEEMLPVIRRDAVWGRREISGQNDCRERLILLQEPSGQEQGQAGTLVVTARYESVVLSLGSGLDRLQDDYTQKGMLLQSYMLEVLASELLLQGYAAYNRYVKEKTGWHVARYHFPGSEEGFPLEMLPRLLEGQPLEVTCNAAFCMLPKKSAAFVAELTQDESVSCEGICMGCSRTGCSNRVADDFAVRRRMAEMTDIPLSYGYSRIFRRAH